METAGSSSQAVSLRAACVPGVPQLGRWLQRPGRARFSKSWRPPCRKFHPATNPAFFPPPNSFAQTEELGGGKNADPAPKRPRSVAEDAGLVEDLAFVPHVVNRPAELRGEDRQRLGLAVLFLLARQPGLAAVAVPHQQA